MSSAVDGQPGLFKHKHFHRGETHTPQ